MTTKAIAGYKGGLYVLTGTVSSKVLEIIESTLTVEQKEIDATTKDSNGWAENIGGMKSFKVDANGLYRSDDSTGQDALYLALTGSTASSIRLWPNDTTSAIGYSGSVIVTSFEIGDPLDNAVTMKVSMVGTGPLTTASHS